MSFRRGLRSPAGIVIALGAAGVVILTLREAVPVARMLLIDPGPLVPPPEPKPNVYRDSAGHALIAATCDPDPGAGVRRVVNLLGGLTPVDVAGQRVVIKPNANSGMPAPASTSPEVLEAVIRLLQEHDAREIIVGEMSGPPWYDTAREMRRNGLLDVIERTGARFVDFKDDAWVTVPLGDRSEQFATASIPRTLYEADRLIGLPTIKTHFLAGYSMSIKLWFGGVHPRNRVATHLSRHRDRILADLNLPFWPDLLILDGSRSLISGGPKKGDVVRTDLFFASGDRIGLDLCGLSVLKGFEKWPAVADLGVWEQPQIQRAAELELGAPEGKHLALVTDPACDHRPLYRATVRQITEWAGIPERRADE